jgi:rhodanese-related sulfurtransferase
VTAAGYEGDLTPQEAWQLLQDEPDAVLVDCRTRAEWSYVGVPDPEQVGCPLLTVEWQRFPSGQVNDRFVDEIREALGDREDAPLVFLCRSGVRSVAAARAATAAGLGRSYNVLDGFEGGVDAQGHRGSTGWRAEGLPWRQS